MFCALELLELWYGQKSFLPYILKGYLYKRLSVSSHTCNDEERHFVVFGM